MKRVFASCGCKGPQREGWCLKRHHWVQERLETAANKYRNVDFSLLVNVNVIEQAEKQNGLHKQIERYENECEILAGRTD